MVLVAATVQPETSPILKGGLGDFFHNIFLMNQSTTTMGTKLKVKIVLLGDQHVGKSCLIDKYINGKFDPNSSVSTKGYAAHCGNRFSREKCVSQGKRVSLTTMGYSRSGALPKSYPELS